MALDIEMMHTCSLAIYPIKGIQAVALETAIVEARGLEGDRRWMIVDANDKSVSQREEPRLTKIKAELSEKGLVVVLPGEMSMLVAKPEGCSAFSRFGEQTRK